MLTMPNEIESELYKDFNNVAIIVSLRYIAKMLPPEERAQLFTELENSIDIRANMLLDHIGSDDPEMVDAVNNAVTNVNGVVSNILDYIKKQVQ